VSSADDRTPPSDGHDRTIGLSAGADSSSSPQIEVPGFTLHEKLGEGGMGVVFRAEQHQPSRPVALKIIRGGPVADDLSLRIFRREADTLARLKHEDIAAVYEVGATPTGQHYLALEFVQGPTLSRWLQSVDTDRTAQKLRGRLRMFASICRAVHYAHQRGVIHRDLKPDNLLVVEDGELATGKPPRVKILDFGLARIVDSEDGEQTVFTRPGMLAGTLPYMSPEQAQGDQAAIDVRTDVYAMGVILQQMLTGKLPYQTSPDSIMSAVKTICETSPATLSTSWPWPGHPDTDLQTIVGKALAKVADERYGSAAALADDIDRFLTSQPISARPPSTIYQLRKLVARKKAPFAAAAVIAALLVVGAVGMSALYLKSERNLARAMAAEQAARLEAETAQRTSEFLVDIFGSADPTATSGETITARQILDEGAKRVRTELKDEPVQQARMMSTIGRVYRELALFDKAVELQTASLDLRRAHLAPDDSEISSNLVELGQAQYPMGDLPAAISTLREAVAFWDAVDSLDTVVLPSALKHLGWMLSQDRQLDEAEMHLQRALKLVRASDQDQDERALAVLNDIGTVRTNAGDLDGALAFFNEALSLARSVHGDRHHQTANVLTNLGTALDASERSVEAEKYNRESLAIRESILGPDHPLVGQAASNLGISLIYQGKAAEARTHFERSLAMMLAVHGPDHPAVAQGQNNLGRLCLETGDLDAANDYLQAALAAREKSHGADHPITGVTLYNLADYHMARGEPQKARALLERVVEIDVNALGAEHPDVAEDLDALAAVLRALGDDEAADAHAARAEEIRQAAAGAG
jgi:serine/threonine protein kinase/tetratricopeptide (TPR) repeat protein